MQAGVSKLNKSCAIRIRDIGILDIPFFGNYPIENFGSCRDLDLLQGDALTDDLERLTNAIARDAPTNRIQFARKGVHLPSDIRNVWRANCLAMVHYRSPKSG